MQEKVSAQYKNEIDMAKAQRDYELKKAAYDIEVNTKKAESEMAYQLQVNKQRKKHLGNVIIGHMSWIFLVERPSVSALYRTGQQQTDENRNRETKTNFNRVWELDALFISRWQRRSSASRRRGCRSRWWSGRSRSCCRSRRSHAGRRSWRPR